MWEGATLQRRAFPHWGFGWVLEQSVSLNGINLCEDIQGDGI